MAVTTKAAVLLAAAMGGWALARGCGSERATVERVAEVEHEQWTAWSRSVAAEVTPERRARWEKYWIPYKDLPEDIKELDRQWARKALSAARMGR
jgi:hypothetical protein